MDVPWYEVTADGEAVMVTLRVTPGARRSEVIDSSGERLRLRIAAPAHEGKANAEVVRFLAECFGVRRSAVEVVRGERSRDKVVRVAGATQPPEALVAKG